MRKSATLLFYGVIFDCEIQSEDGGEVENSEF